jgi:hypothetical protein
VPEKGEKRLGREKGRDLGKKKPPEELRRLSQMLRLGMTPNQR